MKQKLRFIVATFQKSNICSQNPSREKLIDISMKILQKRTLLNKHVLFLLSYQKTSKIFKSSKKTVKHSNNFNHECKKLYSFSFFYVSELNTVDTLHQHQSSERIFFQEYNLNMLRQILCRLQQHCHLRLFVHTQPQT